VAAITAIDIEPSSVSGLTAFEIRQSLQPGAPTARISPDLCICGPCLAELFDPGDPRYRYSYINCIDCGPRYPSALGLPYDLEARRAERRTAAAR
jgi:hydrogenase maturation protein HypF